MPAAKVFPTSSDPAPVSSLGGSGYNKTNHLDPDIGSKKNALPDAALPFTRALLSSGDRRCGPSTPAPAWKLFEDPFYDAMAAAAARHRRRPPAPAAANRRTTVSARKLAATLWESQDIPFSRDVAANETKELPSDNKAKEPQRKQQQPTEVFVSSNPKRFANNIPHAPSPASTFVSQRLRRRSSLEHKFGDSFKKKLSTSRQIPSAHSQVLKLLDRRAGLRPAKSNDLDISEIEGDGRSITPSLNRKAIPRKYGQGPATSGELLNVLNRIWTLEEQHDSSMLMVDELHADLEKARNRVEELTAQQKSHCEHIENLTKELAKEKAVWQEREQEAIKVAVLSMKKDLEDERKSKRKLDLLYRKGAKELSDVKKSLEKAVQDLDREQKARELMEDVCDELAREIGEDRAQVEELRRESAKVREEVEEERKMLQMAEVWREERVQMKLAEARLQLEEKNTALDKLRSELESFLKAKRAWDSRDEGSRTKSAKASDMLSSLNFPSLENSGDENADLARHTDLASVIEVQGTARPGKELVDDCDSTEEDLHSIEFGKDSRLGHYEGCQSRYNGVIQPDKGSDGNGWLSIDMESPPGERSSKTKSGQGNRQGLQRTYGSNVEAVLATGERREKGGKWDYQLDNQWIADSIEERESRERRGERGSFLDLREGLHSPWQSDNEESQSHGSMSFTGKGRHLQGRASSSSRSGCGERTGLRYEAAAISNVSGNSAARKFQKSQGNSRDLKASAGSFFVEPTANSTFSPTREWVQYWSSPDPRSPRFSRAKKTPNDVPQVGKDNSLKARLLEAKLEGQLARLRRGKGV